ncbi:PadR family transcriptional regulator [Paenibacillus sp. YIM B09110]|uniref:PadR family transcriptional regulator n=1 Tax=Paenibacillus sp. YIM B09110 TaxID=3126102 RepID=UPI00301BA99C
MTLQIFILGTLSEGERHPYDLKKQVLKSLDSAISINDGTLYYHFEVLAKKGLIKKIKVVQSENRPEKTTYGITDKGRKALEDDIYAVFQNVTNVTTLYSSLLFLDKVDKHKLAYLIEESIDRMAKRIELIENSDPELLHDISENKLVPVKLISEHAYQMLQNNLTWLQKLLAYVRGE